MAENQYFTELHFQVALFFDAVIIRFVFYLFQNFVANTFCKLLEEYLQYYYTQKCTFPKIQPATICEIELNWDKNQASMQWRSGLSTELSTIKNPCLVLLFGHTQEF